MHSENLNGTQAAHTQDRTSEDETSKHFVARASWVFNAAQVDGFEPQVEDLPDTPLFTPVARAEAFATCTGARIEESGDQACFVPSLDLIRMPERCRFIDTAKTMAAEGFYGTLFHELVHRTGVSHRLDIGYAIDVLDRFWGDQPVSAITGAACRSYAVARNRADGTIRRELGVLQAAVNYCVKEGRLVSAPKVTLPPKPPARERWLTRQEASWLLRGARSLNRDGRHLAYFILCGLYTGSRKATILGLHFDMPSSSGGHVDIENCVLYRKPAGKIETKKRQRPARLPSRYLAHLVRQKRAGRRYVVEDAKGRRVGDIRKGWARSTQLAKEMAAEKGIAIDLTDVVPHTLRHTAITWALQRGATIWDVAGMFSVSIETIQQVYGHHSPDWQRSAVDAMSKKS